MKMLVIIKPYLIVIDNYFILIIKSPTNFVNLNFYKIIYFSLNSLYKKNRALLPTPCKFLLRLLHNQIKFPISHFFPKIRAALHPK